MKKRILAVLTLILLSAGNIYAAPGDVNVEGKLGVGTNTPNAKVEIVQQTQDEWSLILNNTVPYVPGGVDASYGLLIYMDGYNQGPAFTIQKNNPGGPTVTIFNVRNDGKVGIGTDTPSSGLALDVEGKVGATEYCNQDGGQCITTANIRSSGPQSSWETLAQHCGGSYCNPDDDTLRKKCYDRNFINWVEYTDINLGGNCRKWNGKGWVLVDPCQYAAVSVLCIK